MTLKDDVASLTYLVSIPKKKVKHVAHKHDRIFGLIGYLNIFHTDDEEYTANTILQLLKDVNPNAVTVTGRSHIPCDQGLVESIG